ncbi:hypothetical protein ACIPJ2_15860 [Curtobacterium sp. NPDC090217]|uniref:hypothetical protein n=1 Tax=Curtobacterium sp. NPDC090217 TaxID=3363970 RepID=UPI00382C71E5
MAIPTSTAVLGAATFGLALAAAAWCALDAAAAGSPGQRFVVGSMGTGSLSVVVWVVGVVFLIVAASGWTWRGTRRAPSAVRIAVRILVSSALVVAAAGSVATLFFVAMLGAPPAYVDVGTVNGHTVVVSESTSLGGLSTQIGIRDGFWVRMATGEHAFVTVDGLPGGRPPSRTDGYRLTEEHGQAVVRFTLGGRQEMRFPLPGGSG